MEIVISHKIVGVCSIAAAKLSVILPRGCQSARLSDCFFSTFERELIRLVGLEPTTPRLSSACSNQLSYSRVDVEEKTVTRTANLANLAGFDLSVTCEGYFTLTP